MKRFEKKWMWMIAVLPGLLMAIDCPAGFLIELKNGTSVVTENYWEENGQIRYRHYGGVVGVDKNMVSTITETDMSIPTEIIKTDLPENENIVLEQAKPEIEKTAVTDFQDNEAQYQEHLRRNHREIVTHVKTYYSAMNQNDQTTMDETRNYIKELQADQELLRKEIMNVYKDKLPDWWYEITEEN
jgi:hypothetical protein